VDLLVWLRTACLCSVLPGGGAKLSYPLGPGIPTPPNDPKPCPIAGGGIPTPVPVPVPIPAPAPTSPKLCIQAVLACCCPCIPPCPCPAGVACGVNPLVSGLGLEVIAAYAPAVRFEGPAASIQVSWGLASDPGVGCAAWRIWSSSPDDREVDPAVPPPGMDEMRCSRLRRRDSRSCVCCCLRESQNTSRHSEISIAERV
jgi:hypothetical protein